MTSTCKPTPDWAWILSPLSEPYALLNCSRFNNTDVDTLNQGHGAGKMTTTAILHTLSKTLSTFSIPRVGFTKREKQVFTDPVQFPDK